MMMAEGELAKTGRAAELLEVIGKYGDPAMDFIWRNKESLAVGTTLAAFLATPETFLNAAQSVAKTVGENVVRPLAEVPGTVVKEVVGEVARHTNWTLVFTVIAICVLLYLFARRGLWRLFPTAAVQDATTTDTASPESKASGNNSTNSRERNNHV